MNAQPCIYCRRTNVQRTREHVLPHSLGGCATLPKEVCGDCNSAFSSIDKYFVEALHFFHTGGKKMFRRLGLGRTVLDDGVSLNARLRADGMGEFPPQIFQVSDTVWRFIGPHEEAFHSMLVELANPGSITVKSQLIQRGDGGPRITVLRSAPNTFLVQAVDALTLERFCETLRRDGLRPDWIGPPTERGLEGCPAIEFATPLELRTYCRAMAKIALNYVCYRFGSDTVLRSEFDRVRHFARYGDSSPFSLVVPTILNLSLSDAFAAYFKEEHHGLAAIKMREGSKCHERVAIVVHGRVVGLVNLAAQGKGLPDDTWILLSRFAPETRTMESFTLPEDMRWAAVNPAALGMQDEWPKEWL